MVSVADAEAVAGQGIKGDRYFHGCGTFSPDPHRSDFELTMIEQEQISAFARDTGLNFNAKQARRNLVTQGISLNDIVGKEFRIGAARFKAIRLCEPCQYLAKTTYPETLKGLVHKGGLRVAILESGMIRTGDSIEVIHSSH